MAGPREQTICGVRAGLAAFARRPDAIRRVFYAERLRKTVADVLRHCAANKRPYREVSDEELARIARSQHHEGLVLVTDPKEPVPLDHLLRQRAPGSVLLVLDGVTNPHNLGAILRSAAAFGAQGLVVCAADGAATLSGAAVRVAEGGAEVVDVAVVPQMKAALRSIRRGGFTVVGTDSEQGDDLFTAPLPRPVAVILGSEGEGLTRDARAECDRLVRIPGTGAVQSLNVSVAAGVLLAELWRTRP